MSPLVALAANLVIAVAKSVGGLFAHSPALLSEASASLAIGALFVYVAYRLGRDAPDQLIGEAADPEADARIRARPGDQPEIDSVKTLFTMKTALVAARVDLVPGLDSEQVVEVAEGSPAATGERGGA